MNQSTKKLTLTVLKIIFLLIFLYLSLFYIAPFVSGIISQNLNSGNQVKAPTMVNSPILNNFPEITNKELIEVSGVTSSNVDVELFINSNSFGSLKSDNEGKFKFENVRILKGINRIYLIATNSENISSPKSREYVLDFDDIKPEIKTINLKDGMDIRNLNNNVVINGETSELSDIEVNEKKVFKKDGNKFEYILGLNEGDSVIKITLQDRAGNENKYEYKINYKKD